MENITYKNDQIVYEYFSRDGILEKRITVPWDLAQKIIEQDEAKGPFGTLDMSGLFRTTSVKQFLNIIR